MREQISIMLQKNAITQVPPDSPGFYSNVFLVRKSTGGWRPFIDLKNLNAYIHAPHFGMFTTGCVLSSVEKGDYAFKIDLQDAYFHVPIHPSSRKYLRFAFENRVYQFQVLPFGLNTAPQVFTHLGHTVSAYLHRQGFSVIPYLDDWLVHHPDRQVLLRHQALLLNTLDLVGFILNRKKSELDLTQDLQFLRIRLRLDLDSLTPRVQGLGDSCPRTPSILPQGTKLYSSVPPPGITQLGLGSHPTGSFVPEASSMLFSFTRADRPVYATASIRPYGPCQPTSAMAGATFSYLRNSDPQFSGGLYDLYGRLQSGVGPPRGEFQDFGYLGPLRPQAPHQLSGVQSGYVCPAALGPFASGPPGYGRHGQFDSSLIRQQAERDFLWLESQSIGVRARHIPGCLNLIADHLSRPNQPISTEWSLHPEIVNRIFRVWGTPEIDMFATLSNSHLPLFVSPIPEPRALAVDALSQDWQGRSMYMFPPFPLLNKVLQKLRSTQVAEVILVAPWWPSQSWFPHLLRLCVEHPLVLPYHRDLLSQQDQKYISDGKLFHPHAWRLSWDTTKRQAFQTRSLSSRQPLEGPQPIACMTIDGVASFDGLQDMALIHLIPQPLR